jgi:hypothetical protein
LAPVITPSLAKRISQGMFAGSNLDDLAQGLQPFAVLVADCTTGAGEQAYNDALAVAHNYDELVGNSTTPDLLDIKSLKGSSLYFIPSTFAAMRAMLTEFVYLLTALFGTGSHLTVAVRSFLNEYTNSENFIMARIQAIDSNMGPARMLCFVQLHVRAYFNEVQNARDGHALAALEAPRLTKAW